MGIEHRPWSKTHINLLDFIFMIFIFMYFRLYHSFIQFKTLTIMSFLYLCSHTCENTTIYLKKKKNSRRACQPKVGKCVVCWVTLALSLHAHFQADPDPIKLCRLQIRNQIECKAISLSLSISLTYWLGFEYAS